VAFDQSDLPDGEAYERKPYLEVDEDILVQCYDPDEAETYFYRYDRESGEYDRIEEYEAESGKGYFPVDVDTRPRSDMPIVKMAEKPEEYESVQALVDEIRGYINSYGDIKEHEEKLCAYYVLLTWVYDRFPVCPYLRFKGDSGKGKTRLLQTVGNLCFFSKLTGSSSASAAMRGQNIWLGTRLFNEADTIDGDESSKYIAWINNGFEKGNFVEMSQKDNPSERVRLDPYGPKLFAMKKRFKDPATESRIFNIEMEETDRDDLPLLLFNEEAETEAIPIRNKLLKFRFDYYGEFDPEEEPEIIRKNDYLEARIKQISLPLYHIVKLIGEDAVQDFIDVLEGMQEQVRRKRVNSQEGRVFNKLYRIATGDEKLPENWKKLNVDGDVSAVTSGAIADTTNLSPHKVTDILEELGFDKRTKKIEVKTVQQSVNSSGVKREMQRIILVPDKQKWKEAVSRYLADYSGDEEVEIPECIKGGKVEFEEEKEIDYQEIQQKHEGGISITKLSDQYEVEEQKIREIVGKE
jgi:hypothetical protein